MNTCVLQCVAPKELYCSKNTLRPDMKLVVATSDALARTSSKSKITRGDVVLRFIRLITRARGAYTTKSGPEIWKYHS